MEYQILDLEIERQESGYRAALNPATDNLAHSFAPPFEPKELEDVKQQLREAGQQPNAADSPALAAIKRFGGRLYDAVFDRAAKDFLQERLDGAQDQDAGVLLRLRLAGGAELIELPWEYLYDAKRERFLFRSTELTLSRYPDSPKKVQPLVIQAPLRILAVIPALDQDADAAWTKLSAALGDLCGRGLIALERLPRARFADLLDRLGQAEPQVHILHFIGQGNFEAGAEDGGLLMEDENARGKAVSGQLLGLKLRDLHRPLRLVVLQTSLGDFAGCPFNGAARGLLEQRMPAVVTMQAAMSDDAAAAFASNLYEALAQYQPVEEAMAKARATISALGNKVEWGSPALSLSAAEGRLFDREKAVVAAPDAPDDRTGQHFALITQKFAEGKVIPFLGAGASLYNRPPGTAYQPGKYLPSGGELAALLAGNLNLSAEISKDLLRVSQYYSLIVGEQPLYDQLHAIFDGEYLITPLHQLLADIPGVLRAKGHGNGHLFIITTNYDDLLERAFRLANEPYDLLYYEAKDNPKHPEWRGKFWHEPHVGEPRLVTHPNQYLDVSPAERSVILKIHGAVDRRNGKADSYVITEDDYIDYMTRTEIATLLPVKLSDKVFESHLLFLGYSLRDWNLRTILHRIEMHRTLSYQSWAIQKKPDEVDSKFWSSHNVNIFDMELEDYVNELDRRIRALPRAGGAG